MTSPVNAAGPPPEPDAARVLLALRRLGVVGRVLYVAAHPDDENTNLLAYLQNVALVRTAYLSMTRGDGGQNLVGSEQGPELGLIRTQELLAARRIDGAEQFFTRARDFGFSKSPDETLRIWGRQAVLADVVSVIRRFRPDVILTRFSPERADTHGHHTASAMLAVEAFRAAADPKFHPEQLEGGVTPWQARRLLWNKSSWNLKPGEDLSGFLKLDVGAFSPLLGVSMGELAADSRSMHKSQGFGVARARGPIVEYFQALDGAPTPKSTLFDGLDLSWGRFKGAASLRALTEKAARAFDANAPHASIPALLALDRALDAVPDASFRAQKKREVADLALACAGLFVEATAAAPDVAPGQELEVVASVIDRAPTKVAIAEVHFPFEATALAVGKVVPAPTPVAAGAALEVKRTIRVPAGAPPTTPYWLDAPPEAGLYRVADAKLIGAPENEPALRVVFGLSIAGRPFSIERAVQYKWTDPVMGERYRPVAIAPLVSVRPDAGVLMFPDSAAHALAVQVTAGAPNVAGVVRPTPPAGWVVEPATAPFSLARKGAAATVTFAVRFTGSAKPGVLKVAAEVGGASYARGVVTLDHAHIPIQTWLADADVRLVPVALTKGGTRLGYVPGPGDEVPAALRRVGYDVTLLDDTALGAASLARFDTVVTGVRAFNTSERLRAAHAALMAYVEAGGTLVVQYNTNSRLGPLAEPLGPWPFDIGHDRVTDETSAVSFASATHPALTTPNALTARDFEGWIQERGLYFAEKWDPRYQTVLTMHDPDEPPLAGSLLWARHGKGTFVYTGLAFFRQLPAGVPGAYRLFANLLAGGSARHGQ
jgi:LmbE family N-acetylglucosaminyl deacetylase